MAEAPKEVAEVVTQLSESGNLVSGKVIRSISHHDPSAYSTSSLTGTFATCSSAHINLEDWLSGPRYLQDIPPLPLSLPLQLPLQQPLHSPLHPSLHPSLHPPLHPPLQLPLQLPLPLPLPLPLQLPLQLSLQPASLPSLALSPSLSEDNLDEYTIHNLATTSMAILKVSNISWDISTTDMVHLFRLYNVDDPDHVHIPIDRSTGKTLNDLFVEMQSPAHVKNAIESLDKTIVKSRALLLSDSSFEELFYAHFPNARQDYTTIATINTTATTNVATTNIATTNATTLNVNLLDSDTVDQIITICQNYKMYFSRRCAERPFEHVISIVRLIPWQSIDKATIIQLFRLVTGTIDALVSHLNRQAMTTGSPSLMTSSTPTTGQINPNVLPRLVQVSTHFPSFSGDQKDIISTKASTTLNCPAASVGMSGEYVLGALSIDPPNADSVPRHRRKSSLERLLGEIEGTNDDIDKLSAKERRNVFLHLMFG